MILSFKIVAALALLVLAGGCAKSPDKAPVPSPRAAATPAAASGPADVIGALKLVRQEYANAVPAEGGSVADATEYAEAQLFAEQAGSKLATFVARLDTARADAIARGVKQVGAMVDGKEPPAHVAAEVGRTIGLVEDLLAGAVPEEIRGAVLAVTRADQAIAAEEISGEYRVAVTTGAARPIYVRHDQALAQLPTQPGQVYLGVLLREKRTKRFLPSSKVTAVLSRDGHDSAFVLTELWGDFHQYGANVTLPADGPVTVTIRASPPAYARHGDMLTHFVSPVTVTLQGRVQQGALHFDGKPITPQDADYAIGDDVLQARTEAGTLHDAGPYRVGLIVEGPEPIWLWHEGAPVLQPVGADATNHLEVVLLDRDTGQLVPGARVTLTFLDGGHEVGSTTLHPLLSIFSHYGETLALPAGVKTVRIHVDPPSLGSVDTPRLDGAADLEVPLPSRREARRDVSRYT
jgi:hypothetical protein